MNKNEINSSKTDPSEDSRGSHIQKHEIYLIVAALILSAVIIGYNALSAPPLISPTIAYLSESESETDSFSGLGAPVQSDVQSAIASSSAGTVSGESSASASSSKTKPSTSVIASSSPTSTVSQKVNINTDGIDRLMELPGIGEVKAKAIINYRSQYGRFTKVEDLLNVDGIGEKTLEKIKPLAVV